MVGFIMKWSSDKYMALTGSIQWQGVPWAVAQLHTKPSNHHGELGTPFLEATKCSSRFSLQGWSIRDCTMSVEMLEFLLSLSSKTSTMGEYTTNFTNSVCTLFKGGP